MKKINPKDIRAGQDFIAIAKQTRGVKFLARAARRIQDGIRTEYWTDDSHNIRFLDGFFEYDLYNFYVEDKQTEQTMKNIQIKDLQVGDVFLARYQNNIINPVQCGVVTEIGTGAYGPKVYADYCNCGGINKKTTFIGKGIFTDEYSFVLVNRPATTSPVVASSNPLVGKRVILCLGSSGVEYKIIEQSGNWIKLSNNSWHQYHEDRFVVLSD